MILDLSIQSEVEESLNTVAGRSFARGNKLDAYRPTLHRRAPTKMPGENLGLVDLEQGDDSSAPEVSYIQMDDRDGHQVIDESEKVPDNMIISLLSICFCCLLGAIATVIASDSRNSAREGNLKGAEKEAKIARSFAIAAIVCGNIIFIAILIAIIVGLVMLFD